MERALAVLAVLRPVPQGGWALDLGSGGGLPGLPLALALPGLHWVLLDGSTTRCGFLSEAVDELNLADSVEVVATRAEDAAQGRLRGSFDLVVSRSFGPPAVTGECAAGFLRTGGHLVVSEPPGSTGDRWPPDGLAKVGLRLVGTVTEPSAFAVMEQVRACPATFPRRTGIPTKRPLWST